MNELNEQNDSDEPNRTDSDPPDPNPSGSPMKTLNTPVIRKVCLAALIFGLLQIPLFMIKGVIEERQTFNCEYPQKYNGAGAGQQTLIGPVLTVPYRYEALEPVAASAASARSAASQEMPPLPPVGASTKAEPDPATGLMPNANAPATNVDGRPTAGAMGTAPGTNNIASSAASATSPAAPLAPPGQPQQGVDKRVMKSFIGYLHFFPESLTVDGVLKPEVRDEGKFKSILYSSDVKFAGSFNTSEFTQKKISADKILWEDAYLSLGISDLRGVDKATSLKWAGANYKFAPGTNGLKLFNTGQHVLLNGLSGGNTYPFSFTLSLHGSRELSVFPAGKENKISLSSSWSDPYFSGGFLPTQRSVTADGFNSQWDVSYFMRNLPQVWTDRDPSIINSLAQYMVGVTLSTPVEFYRTTIRAVKYGSLFISMTFMAFFLFEIMTKVRIHEIQYLFVGLALCLFFLMLIAVSEWIPFTWAYVIATVPTIVQITWYTQAFTKSASKLLWKVTASTLSVLYVYLYVLLQLENYSLLCGAIGLFLALSVVLYTTRNINWYSEEKKLA
jgi:inner membrane protein